MAYKKPEDKYFPEGMIEKPGTGKVVARYLGQVAIGVAAALIIGYFSASPAYTYREPGTAQVKLSILHIGERVVECEGPNRSDFKGPTNRISFAECPRERVPVMLELEMDGKVIVQREDKPAGLAHDGPSLFYHREFIPAGSHTFTIRMRDNREMTGFDYEETKTVEVEEGRNLVITFRPEKGGFLFY